MQSWVPDLGQGRFVVAALFAVLLYVSVLIHELGHALAARRLRPRCTPHHPEPARRGHRDDAEEQRPGEQVVISAAGPLLSLALGAVGLVVRPADPGTLLHLLALALGFSNLLVGVFNLLPGLPLDGGQLLRAVLWKVTGSWHGHGGRRLDRSRLAVLVAVARS